LQLSTIFSPFSDKPPLLFRKLAKTTTEIINNEKTTKKTTITKSAKNEIISKKA
jgi:hypothetical protein